MNEIDEIVALEQKIAIAKERGERLTRGFWGAVAIFGFFCFSWIFLLPKTNPGLNNLPFYFIGGFGLIAIVVLVSSDLIFFNKTFVWQEELDQKLSARTGRILGVDPKKVSLRKSAISQQFFLLVTLDHQPVAGEKIVDETKGIQLSFRLNVETFHEVFALLETHRSHLTRF
jgi:hypothetical protein